MEALLAALLLFSDVDAQPAWVTVLRAPLLALAVDAEILDHRELPSLDNWAKDPLDMLRGRARDLHGAPMVAEVERFPSRLVAHEWLAANRQYEGELEVRLALDLVHADEIRTALCETRALFRAVDALRDAASPAYHVQVRRASLRTLREAIGLRAFLAGELGAPVPLRHLPVR